MPQDGAYATWQKMVALKVVPDEISQRALALAFGGNPQMASALVKEAQQLQVCCDHGLPILWACISSSFILVYCTWL